ncbi:hypothetical protein GA0074696_4135 [Micromonospora purpureochromogenes]|uniref:Uncharacterized protein n=1 Tax=Micromonospora purpureochromogenes TaxID=47872 RepID=A0A1C4Z811_9ACTN|nr:hypothetical protein GA0074696_4135 [Micromonospora purpureochromogenes]
MSFGQWHSEALEALSTASAAIGRDRPRTAADVNATVTARSALFTQLARVTELLVGGRPAAEVPDRAGAAAILARRGQVLTQFYVGLRAAAIVDRRFPPASIAVSTEPARSLRRAADAVGVMGDILASHVPPGRGPCTPEGLAIRAGGGVQSGLAKIARLTVHAATIDIALPGWLDHGQGHLAGDLPASGGDPKMDCRQPTERGRPGPHRGGAWTTPAGRAQRRAISAESRTTGQQRRGGDHGHRRRENMDVAQPGAAHRRPPAARHSTWTGRARPDERRRPADGRRLAAGGHRSRGDPCHPARRSSSGRCGRTGGGLALAAATGVRWLQRFSGPARPADRTPQRRAPVHGRHAPQGAGRRSTATRAVRPGRIVSDRSGRIARLPHHRAMATSRQR